MHSHPRWIAQAFADALGGDAGQLDALLASDDARPLVHLAARPECSPPRSSRRRCRAPSAAIRRYAVYLPGGDPGRLAPIRDGQALVQDEGSQLVARATALAELTAPTADAGWTCAPGRAARPRCWRRWAPAGARVTAIEPAPQRAELVEQNTRGLPVEVLRVDGRDSGLEPGFDRVLVDVPCTGLGALRRRPEARWRRQPGDVPALAKLQRELLASAIALTRPGGVVLYATCSPHLAETVGVVADALRRHPVRALDARPLFEPVEGLGDGPYAQLWPHRHGTDAMFAARALQVNWRPCLAP